MASVHEANGAIIAARARRTDFDSVCVCVCSLRIIIAFRMLTINITIQFRLMVDASRELEPKRRYRKLTQPAKRLQKTIEHEMNKEKH